MLQVLQWILQKMYVVVVVVVVVDLQHKADGCCSLSVFIRRLSTYFCIGCNRTQVAKCK